MSINVIGTVFVDIKGHPFETFIPDGRNAGYMEQVHGGVARNVAEDLANIQEETKLVSLVDRSGTGADVLERLERKGVCIDYAKKTSQGMGTWLAIFNERGDVAANISIRPDLDPMYALIKDNEDAIFEDTDMIVFEMDIDRKVSDYVMECAKRHKKKVFALVSVMSIALERREYLPDLYAFICNEQEAGMLFERDLSSLETEELIALLSSYVKTEGPENMIVTLGEKGAVYASKTGENGYCPAVETAVLDTTGAGDSFCAGAASIISKGGSLKRACEVGSILAAAVIANSENVCPVYKDGFDKE